MSLKPKNVNFDEVWSSLLNTMKNVISCSVGVKRSMWNDSFSDIYALCVSSPVSYGDKLYDETTKFLHEYVTQKREQLVEGEDNTLLHSYSLQWEKFSRGAAYLNQLYGYLNNQIRRNNYSDSELMYGSLSKPKTLEIGALAHDIWKIEMIEQITPKLKRLLFESIDFDDAKIIDYKVLKCVLNSLVEVESDNNQTGKLKLDLYESLFENDYLQKIYDYYILDSQLLLDSNTCSGYMNKVIQKLEIEELRCQKFMNPTSHIKVKTQCEKAMVLQHSDVLHSQCHVMVNNEHLQDLANMYRLLVNLSVSILVSEMETHIKNVGFETFNNLTPGSQMPIEYVEKMFDIHTKYNEMIVKCFDGNAKFTGALDKAFSQIINYKPTPKLSSRSPELVSRYCDILLKKSMKGVSECELDDKLQNVITIFKYLDDKDIFQRHYAKMLARRLIHSLSNSMDAEENMINRLKQTCGYEYTQKLHRMFTDVSISSDLHSKYEEFDEKSSLSNMVLVLQAGAWPISLNNSIDFQLPDELMPTVVAYNNFYKKNFSGRKLTWMYQLGTVELKVKFTNKPYVITLGCHQAAILLCFNDDLKFTLSQLEERTKLEKEELNRILTTLFECKILLSEEDCVILNENFINKRTKFKILSNFQRNAEFNQDIEKTNSTIEEDRKMYLQATIVRVMKSRKIFRHNLLIQEVIKQCQNRFIPNVSIIKKTIESLIEKSYIERSSPDTYCYVA